MCVEVVQIEQPNFFCMKNVKKAYFNQLWSAKHPDAGQNIQHTRYISHAFTDFYIIVNKNLVCVAIFLFFQPKLYFYNLSNSPPPHILSDNMGADKPVF